MENKESFFAKNPESEESSRIFLHKEFNEEIDLFFQEEFLKAVEANDETQLAELKQRYLNDYPDQIEIVEALFGLRDFLLKDKKIAEEKEQKDYKIERSRFQDLTEYQFLFTHFIIENNSDRKFLEKFWDIGRIISEKTDTTKQFNNFRQGILSQTAVYKILEALGEKPKLSHPAQDAFNAVDLWAAKKMAVQVKGSRDIKKPAVIESENAAFPAVEAKSKYQTRYYNAKYFHDNARFRAKLRNYGRQIGEEIKGYILVIPYSKIDPVTGQSSQELVEFFNGKLRPEGKDIYI